MSREAPDIVEQRRWGAAFAHPSRDGPDLELGIHFGGYSAQMACSFQRIQVFSQVTKGHHSLHDWGAL
jgi:hypothetical protein